MDLTKLTALAKAQQKTVTRQAFKKVAIYLGVEPKEHFAKKKDAQGNTLKDENGSDIREENSDGWTYTFSEVGTSKIIKVVLPKQVKVDMLSAYIVSGLGFDIRSGNMAFIDEGGQVALYQ